jgi:hypothetical protein
MEPKPQLNEEEKRQIETLSAAGWSPHRIGKHLKRSRHTIVKHLSQPGIAAKVQDEKSVLAEKCRAQAHRILDSINDTDISKASLQQKSISSGVLLDKSLLLTGDAPSVNIHILLEAVQAVRAIRRQPPNVVVDPQPELPSGNEPPNK